MRTAPHAPSSLIRFVGYVAWAMKPFYRVGGLARLLAIEMAVEVRHYGDARVPPQK